MRRTGLFVAMLASSVAALLVVAWYLSSSQGGYGSMTGLMGQMMGNQYAQGTVATMPSYVWTAILTLFILVVVGIFGLVYYLAYPEIKIAAPPQATVADAQPRPSDAKESWDAVLRTSKPEERKVLEVLATHDGTHLQKLIVKESGLSKLKTHRIVSRFVERGIATAVKTGNTNEISLTPWLNQDLKDRKSP
jgi:uncharacterized membrane protein